MTKEYNKVGKVRGSVRCIFSSGENRAVEKEGREVRERWEKGRSDSYDDNQILLKGSECLKKSHFWT